MLKSFRSPRSVFAVAAIALGVVAPVRAVRPAEACVHLSAGAPISQRGQQALIVHHDGVEHLVLRVEYETGARATTLGMVVPLPAVPTEYGTADTQLFEQLDQWVHLRREPAPSHARGLRGRPIAAATAARDSLVVMAAMQVGPYRIQPLRAQGADGARALQSWMREHGFTPLPDAALTYYVQRNWTFVTVQVDPATGRANLDANGPLPPLRMTFRTPTIVYPLRLEAQGTFAVRAYLVTRAVLPAAALDGAVDRGFEVAAGPSQPYRRGRDSTATQRLLVDVDRFESARAPGGLMSLLRGSATWAQQGSLALRVLLAERFGQGASDPTRWAEELTVPGLPAGRRVEGTR